MFSRSESVAGEPGGSWLNTGGAPNCPVVLLPTPLFPAPKKLMPSCEAALRSTSAKRTFNRICGSASGTGTRSRLTTLPSVPAIAAARSAATVSDTVPRRKTFPSSAVIATPGPTSCRSCSSTISIREVLAGTWTSNLEIAPVLSQSNSVVSPGDFPSSSTSVGLSAAASAISLLAMEIRFNPSGRRSTIDVFTATTSSPALCSSSTPSRTGDVCDAVPATSISVNPMSAINRLIAGPQWVYRIFACSSLFRCKLLRWRSRPRVWQECSPSLEPQACAPALQTGRLPKPHWSSPAPCRADSAAQAAPSSDCSPNSKPPLDPASPADSPPAPIPAYLLYSSQSFALLRVPQCSVKRSCKACPCG